MLCPNRAGGRAGCFIGDGNFQMQVLIADDNLPSRQHLQGLVATWGFDVVSAGDGEEAWQVLQASPPPQLAVLDWMMPKIEGLELCRRARSEARLQSTYVIILTARDDPEDVLTGLEGGADDYLTKPVNFSELRARLNIGRRLVTLQSHLAERVHELEAAMSRIHHLQGLLPICSYCKKIRDDHNYWQQVDSYISAHSAIQFSHGICPECYANLVEQSRVPAVPPS